MHFKSKSYTNLSTRLPLETSKHLWFLFIYLFMFAPVRFFLMYCLWSANPVTQFGTKVAADQICNIVRGWDKLKIPDNHSLIYDQENIDDFSRKMFCEMHFLLYLRGIEFNGCLCISVVFVKYCTAGNNKKKLN